MVEFHLTGDELWARIQRAVDKVKDRLERATSALDEAGIPYAVIGGNAVQVWVAQIDETAVRNTRDVDILLRRGDLPAAIKALAKHGFIYQHLLEVHMFLDGSIATPRDAVHIIFANEKVREEYSAPAPDVNDSEFQRNYRTLKLFPLVVMKLTSNRDKDRTHIRDMIEVGLIDQSWVERVPAELQARLQEMLDTPNG